MYPLGVSILFGLSFGIFALASVHRLVKRLWAGIAVGIVTFALTVISSMLNIEGLFIAVCCISLALFLIALIKDKITKG